MMKYGQKNYLTVWKERIPRQGLRERCFGFKVKGRQWYRARFNAIEEKS